MILSPKILEELHNVLTRDRFRQFVTVADAEAFIAALVRRAEFAEDPSDPSRISPDPNDDYLPAPVRTPDNSSRKLGEA